MCATNLYVHNCIRTLDKFCNNFNYDNLKNKHYLMRQTALEQLI